MKENYLPEMVGFILTNFNMIYNIFLTKLFTKQISIYDKLKVVLVTDLYEPSKTDTNIPEGYLFSSVKSSNLTLKLPYLSADSVCWSGLEGEYRYLVMWFEKEDETIPFVLYDYKSVSVKKTDTIRFYFSNFLEVADSD